MIGKIINAYVPIKPTDTVEPEDIVFPGLKRIIGVIVKENKKHKKVLALIDGNTHWMNTRHMETVQ